MLCDARAHQGDRYIAGSYQSQDLSASLGAVHGDLSDHRALNFESMVCRRSLSVYLSFDYVLICALIYALKSFACLCVHEFSLACLACVVCKKS
jgi:hypothetical protein